MKADIKMNAGQSLIEVLVGLTIGAILIGGASLGVGFILKSTTSNDNLQSASGIVRQALDEVRSYASANWQNIYGLTKGSSASYFLNSSGTIFYTIGGKEGVLSRDVTNGLVGRWGFDEATGTIAYDMSGNGNNGTLMNSPTRATSTCQVGYCLSFNGTNTVDIAATSTINFVTNGTFSISVWINPDTFSTTWRRGIMRLENYLTSGYRFGFGGSGQPLFWTSQSGGTILLSGSSNLVLNKLNNLVVTYNNQQGNMYLNGILIASSTGTYIAGNNTLRLGDNVNNEKFSGIMDDVRIYNRALSATEVKNLYDSKPFSSFFTVENVCRSNDSSSTIVSTEPCVGGSISDPITQRLTSRVEWNDRGTSNNMELGDYITRWENKVFHQTDWSGGSGIDGPLTLPNTQYSSSTNVDATTNKGSIRIQGL